jgi:hypothetical protein
VFGLRGGIIYVWRAVCDLGCQSLVFAVCLEAYVTHLNEPTYLEADSNAVGTAATDEKIISYY